MPWVIECNGEYVDDKNEDIYTKSLSRARLWDTRKEARSDITEYGEKPVRVVVTKKVFLWRKR